MSDRIFIKGFDKDLKCRDYQFEIGKEYKIDLPDGYELTENDLCGDKVFHFCDGLSKVHEYYSCEEGKNNRYCIVEVLGQFCEKEDKCGSDHIRIVREITGEELKIAKGLCNGNTGLFNSGDLNSGDLNSGDRNIGNLNSGDLNSGDRNSGIFNKTNGSNGVFCNKEPNICIFNIQTNWTLSEFRNSKYFNAILSSNFPLIEWEHNLGAKENSVNGKLIVNTYEEACRRWWNKMSAENKAIIKDIPNFDVDVFCDITGIDKSEV